MQRVTFDTQATQGVFSPGEYVYYLSGSAGGLDAGIELEPERGGSKVKLRPGQGVRFKETNTSWQIVPAVAGMRVIGELVIGTGEFSDNRVSGQVEVIDGARTRTFAGIPFSGYAGIGAQGAGLYGKVQLWNPAGSGKNLLVYRVEPYATVSTVIVTVRETVALGTLATNAHSHDLSLGAGTSVAQIRTAAPATQGVGTGALRVFNIRAATPEVILFAHPVLVRPGNGFTVHSNTPANSDIAATFEFLEEPV
jgi:hypothetical protein